MGIPLVPWPGFWALTTARDFLDLRDILEDEEEDDDRDPLDRYWKAAFESVCGPRSFSERQSERVGEYADRLGDLLDCKNGPAEYFPVAKEDKLSVRDMDLVKFDLVKAGWLVGAGGGKARLLRNC
jgi:hypothetical protein